MIIIIIINLYHPSLQYTKVPAPPNRVSGVNSVHPIFLSPPSQGPNTTPTPKSQTGRQSASTSPLLFIRMFFLLTPLFFFVSLRFIDFMAHIFVYALYNNRVFLNLSLSSSPSLSLSSSPSLSLSCYRFGLLLAREVK